MMSEIITDDMQLKSHLFSLPITNEMLTVKNRLEMDDTFASIKVYLHCTILYSYTR